MAPKTIYCIIWSVALWVATFYPLLNESNVFVFKGKLLLDVAQSHIFPMVMAMTLYLGDVLYHLLRNDCQHNILIWVLGTIIVFMIAFVLSLLANCNLAGWFFFIVAWGALTVLKYKTTECEQPSPYPILED